MRYLLLLMCLYTMSSEAQVSHGCDEIEYPTPGDDPTLCETYEDITTWTLWSSVTYTSTIGSKITNEDLWIKNDVYVDNSFEFENCVVRIDPGVSIFVNYGKLVESDNSKFYCCEDFWKGFILDDLSRIRMINGSHVEDAEIAINAKEDLTEILIDQSTFNRNKVGVYMEHLGKSPTTYGGPLLYALNKSTFSCTSPMNDSKIGDVGILTKGCPLVPIGSNNTFQDIHTGIGSILDRTNVISLDGVNMFKDLLIDGIMCINGVVVLNKSIFHNCQENGIYLERTRHLSLNNCEFKIDAVSDDPLSTVGVFLKDLKSSAQVSIKNSSFVQQDDDQSFVGIQIQPLIVMPGTEMAIHTNTFDFVAATGAESTGIRFDGVFGMNTVTSIFNNEFELSRSVGIDVRGTKNNFSLYENDFIGQGTGIANQGLYGTFSGSNGSNNLIHLNESFYNVAGPDFLTGFFFNGFDNALICKNKFRSARRAFSFFDTNNGTDFRGNTSIYDCLVEIYPGASIDDQEHKGNRLSFEINPLQTIANFPPGAECRGNTDLSNFIVHEPRSEVEWPFLNQQAHWSAFFPYNITPDNSITDWWVYDASGSPITGCASQYGSGDTIEILSLDSAIIYGLIDTMIDFNDNRVWNLNYDLYKSLLSQYTTNQLYNFEDFIDSLDGSSIDDLFYVESNIDVLLFDEAIVDSLETKLVTIQAQIEAFVLNDSISMSNDSTYFLNVAQPSSPAIDTIMQHLESSFDLDSTHLDDISYDIDVLLTYNQNITTTANTSEYYKKKYFELYLDYISTGSIDSLNRVLIEGASDLCPLEYGKTIYNFRSLSQYCDKDNWNVLNDTLCIDSILNSQSLVTSVNGSYPNNSIIKVLGDEVLVTISAEAGIVEISDIRGLILDRFDVLNGEYRYDLSTYSNHRHEFLFVQAKMSDGSWQSVKVFIEE